MANAERFKTKEKAGIEKFGSGEFLVAQIENLSATGACIKTDTTTRALQKGDVVRFTVLLKALNRKHLLNAEVVWVEGRKSGLQFISKEKVLEKLLVK